LVVGDLLTSEVVGIEDGNSVTSGNEDRLNGLNIISGIVLTNIGGSTSVSATSIDGRTTRNGVGVNSLVNIETRFSVGTSTTRNSNSEESTREVLVSERVTNLDLIEGGGSVGNLINSLGNGTRGKSVVSKLGRGGRSVTNVHENPFI